MTRELFSIVCLATAQFGMAVTLLGVWLHPTRRISDATIIHLWLGQALTVLALLILYAAHQS